MFLLPDVGTIFWMTIIFGITVFVLAKYAWKPLIGILREREKSITTALEAAHEAEAKIDALKNEQERIIKQTLLEKDRIIREASEQRELIIQGANKRASTETQQIISDAHKQIKLEKEKAVLEIKNQIANLSVEIATKIILTEMQDKEKQIKTVRKIIEKIDLN